jgi:peptidoglycan/LPS O-acetylase OafA/YrhL
MLLNRLRRVTSGGQWIPEVDGMRFVAISSVLLFHMLAELATRSGRIIPVEAGWQWLEAMLHHGNRGVEFFFVISGMILGMPFARQYLASGKPVSLTKYYMRRVTRLEPPYVVSILVAMLLFAVYQHGVHVELVQHALANLFYLHNLIYGQTGSVNAVAWSLEIEIQFYILAPLMMQIYRIRQTWIRRGVLLFGILCIGAAQMPYHLWPRFSFSILYYAQYFLAGLLLADVYVEDLEQMRTSWLWDVAGAGAFVAIFGIAESTWWHMLMPVAIFVLCVAAMRSHLLRQFFANRWIAIIGGMCYSIYLLHFLLIAVLFKVTRYAILPSANFFTNYLIQILVTLLPVVALCGVFYVLIEHPCMDPKWPEKLRQTLRGAAKS